MAVLVVDASVVLELLVGNEGAPAIAERLSGEDLHAPHLIDVECAHVLRRLVQAGTLTQSDAQGALDELMIFPLERHSHLDLLPRIWGLRSNLTSYDAAYVALAEALDSPLVTLDGKLGRAPGNDALIEVISRGG